MAPSTSIVAFGVHGGNSSTEDAKTKAKTNRNKICPPTENYIMDNRPIKRFAHGIIDYGFAASLFILPSLLGVKRRNARLYAVMGSGLAAVNAITNHGAEISPKLSFQDHKQFDMINLATMASVGCTKAIRTDRKALPFHATLLVLTLTHFLLTDWDS
jgi:hypothetical protein